MKVKLASKVNLSNTILFFALGQFILFLIISLIFGLNHPLFFLMEQFNINVYIVAACLLVIPFYLLFGVFGVVVRDKHAGLRKSFASLLKIVIGFYLLFLVGAVALRYYRISDLPLQLYILLNYPMGFALNNLSEEKDLIEPILLLTAILPGVAYYIGAIWRLNFLRKKTLFTDK